MIGASYEDEHADLLAEISRLLSALVEIQSMAGCGPTDKTEALNRIEQRARLALAE